MNKRNPSNVPASVRARLLNRARENSEEYNVILVRYAAERFLFRLGCSRFRDLFVLKGAMLFVLWEGDMHRTTRDLDFLGHGVSEVDSVVRAIQEICAVDVGDDGSGSMQRRRRANGSAKIAPMRASVCACLRSSAVPEFRSK